jgi:hypothetical protein
VLGLNYGRDSRQGSTTPGLLNSANSSADEQKQSNIRENTDPGKVEPAQTGTEVDGAETLDDVSGVYRVNVVTNKGARYSTNITIKDLGSNIQINANYKGMKIPLTGILVGSRTKSSGSWSFSASIPLLFNGTGTASIKLTRSGLAITGQGSGDYFSFEGDGNGSATGSGSRVPSTKQITSGKTYFQGIEKTTSFAAPTRPYPTPSPMNSGAAAAATAVGLAATAGISARNRIRKNKNPESSSQTSMQTSMSSESSPANLKTEKITSDISSHKEFEAEQGGE